MWRGVMKAGGNVTGVVTTHGVTGVTAAAASLSYARYAAATPVTTCGEHRRRRIPSRQQTIGVVLSSYGHGGSGYDIWRMC